MMAPNNLPLKEGAGEMDPTGKSLSDAVASIDISASVGDSLGTSSTPATSQVLNDGEQPLRTTNSSSLPTQDSTRRDVWAAARIETVVDTSSSTSTSQSYNPVSKRNGRSSGQRFGGFPPLGPQHQADPGRNRQSQFRDSFSSLIHHFKPFPTGGVWGKNFTNSDSVLASRIRFDNEFPQAMWSQGPNRNSFHRLSREARSSGDEYVSTSESLHSNSSNSDSERSRGRMSKKNLNKSHRGRRNESRQSRAQRGGYTGPNQRPPVNNNSSHFSHANLEKNSPYIAAGNNSQSPNPPLRTHGRPHPPVCAPISSGPQPMLPPPGSPPRRSHRLPVVPGSNNGAIASPLSPPPPILAPAPISQSQSSLTPPDSPRLPLPRPSSSNNSAQPTGDLNPSTPHCNNPRAPLNESSIDDNNNNNNNNNNNRSANNRDNSNPSPSSLGAKAAASCASQNTTSQSHQGDLQIELQEELARAQEMNLPIVKGDSRKSKLNPFAWDFAMPIDLKGECGSVYTMNRYKGLCTFTERGLTDQSNPDYVIAREDSDHSSPLYEESNDYPTMPVNTTTNTTNPHGQQLYTVQTATLNHLRPSLRGYSEQTHNQDPYYSTPQTYSSGMPYTQQNTNGVVDVTPGRYHETNNYPPPVHGFQPLCQYQRPTHQMDVNSNPPMYPDTHRVYNTPRHALPGTGGFAPQNDIPPTASAQPNPQHDPTTPSYNHSTSRFFQFYTPPQQAQGQIVSIPQTQPGYLGSVVPPNSPYLNPQPYFTPQTHIPNQSYSYHHQPSSLPPPPQTYPGVGVLSVVPPPSPHLLPTPNPTPNPQGKPVFCYPTIVQDPNTTAVAPVMNFQAYWATIETDNPNPIADCEIIDCETPMLSLGGCKDEINMNEKVEMDKLARQIFEKFIKLFRLRADVISDKTDAELTVELLKSTSMVRSRSPSPKMDD